MLEHLTRAIASLSPSEHGFAYYDPTATPSGRGRLSGWIIPAKDLDHVAGMPTTFGAAQRTVMATTTSRFVQQLLDQGALVPGKSAVSELGMSIDAEPRGLPAVDNPLYPGCTPGGSSGGAAVMVARGLVRAAHASDAGGSIRVPAAATGTVGFKPSSPELAAQGFITTTVSDQAFLHEIRPHRRPMRIALLIDPLFAPSSVDPRWARAATEAAATLARLGHTVERVWPYPDVTDTFMHFRRLISQKVAGLDEHEGLAGWLSQQGRAVSRRQLTAAQRHSSQLAAHVADHYRADMLLTPTLAYDPPATGTFSSLEPAQNFDAQTLWSPWCSLFNLSGTAAISVPWARPGAPGLPPVAVHLGALDATDAEVIGVAKELEAHNGLGHRRR
ncbi:amidase family protein [Corynebacterium renale]|uniref:amidase family protein n=1 Tax=Corynebacterium renale TaxID=1724 RepID=UPI000E01C3D2|nr:amidase [Corynebacterium renale]STC95613.1 amidase [Corynebacterium renale]